ncbi:MAG: hypothetical protein KBE22_17375 [Candidatus Accumulibacter sp.]|nr:hypothetical protein [Accumulibacter sp.]
MRVHEHLNVLTVHELTQRRSLALLGNRSTRKADIVETLAHYLLSGDLGGVWARLSEIEISAIAEAVHNWRGWFDAQRFHARYGKVPTYLGARRYGLSNKPAEPPSVLPLFFYSGAIPDDLQPRLARLVARPAELAIETLRDEDLPATLPSHVTDRKSEPLRRVATEALVRHDLPAVLRLIGQGGIAVGPKTGVPGAAAVAKLEAILLGGDWYQPEDDLRSANWAGGAIRPIRPFAWPLLLQVGGLAKMDGSKLALTARGSKALSQPLAEVVPQLFARWQAKGSPDELRRVDLIKGQTSRSAQLSAVADRRLVIADALIDCCPVGRWIAIGELFRQMLFRGHEFDVTHNAWGLYFGDPNYGSLGAQGCAGFQILQGRYVLVYLFEYLATLGMLDVAYTTPYHVRPDYSGAWGTDEFLFLSRYDGLRYVRLNALGAFCLGMTPNYCPSVDKKPPLLAAESDLGLTLLRDPEPAERLLLEQIAKPLSANRWLLDPDALLKQSAEADERQRIRDFLTAAFDGDLPTDFRQLLDSIDERATALVDAGSARLIRCKDAAIAALLGADPSTAAHCVRAGDRLVCVPEQRLAAFRKGIAKLGLVLPETPLG